MSDSLYSIVEIESKAPVDICQTIFGMTLDGHVRALKLVSSMGVPQMDIRPPTGRLEGSTGVSLGAPVALH